MSKLQTRQCNNTNNNNIFAHLFLVVLPRFVVVVCFSALPSWSRPSILLLLLLLLLLAHFYCYPAHSHPVSLYTLLFGNVSHLILIAKSLFFFTFFFFLVFSLSFVLSFRIEEDHFKFQWKKNLLHHSSLLSPNKWSTDHRQNKKTQFNDLIYNNNFSLFSSLVGILQYDLLLIKHLQ